jgi:hypothetical protein
MRQLSSELLISIPLHYGENQEIETDALRTLLIRIVRLIICDTNIVFPIFHNLG